MFNPLYPFTKEVLEATVKRGGFWFVRNTFVHGPKTGSENIRGSYLITHYNDEAKAEAHFNIVSHDPHRFLYSWLDESSRRRLKKASAMPVGFKIYSSYFYPDYQKKMSKAYKEKINRYMYRHTNWQPAGGDIIKVNLYLQFGQLYLHLKYAGQELKIKFAEIESLS